MRTRLAKRERLANKGTDYTYQKLVSIETCSTLTSKGSDAQTSCYRIPRMNTPALIKSAGHHCITGIISL